MKPTRWGQPQHPQLCRAPALTGDGSDMATATDYPRITAQRPVLHDVVLSWHPGADIAAIRPVSAGGVLELPWFVRIDAERLENLAQYAAPTAEGMVQLRVLRELP